MKRKKRRGQAGSTPNSTRSNRLSRAICLGIGGVVLAAAIYYFAVHRFGGLPEESNRTFENAEPTDLKPEALLKVTVERAYEIDVQFQRVYNAAWEAANGAIGEAFLYAATGDGKLLNMYLNKRRMSEMSNGTWVDDRAWICLGELYWWKFSGRKHSEWVEDAKKRYDEARKEGRLSHHEGFWSWYTWAPDANVKDMIIMNSNTNQMVTVAGMLYEATKEKKYYDDALLVWEGDAKYPGIEKTFYRGEGKWEGKAGRAAFGKQLPWEEASYLSVAAEMYRITDNPKYKRIAVLSAERIMNPANGWVDPDDYYQLRMDGNGAFVHSVMDAYLLAPDSLADIPRKVGRMLEHVWSNHHGASYVLLHRLSDNGIRNGWNPKGGEEGYGVDEIGTVHAQSQALRAFGVYAFVLHERFKKP